MQHVPSDWYVRSTSSRAAPAYPLQVTCGPHLLLRGHRQCSRWRRQRRDGDRHGRGQRRRHRHHRHQSWQRATRARDGSNHRCRRDDASATADAVVTLPASSRGDQLDVSARLQPARLHGARRGRQRRRRDSDATATASGGVDSRWLSPLGAAGYTNPTVEFDMPDDPNGTTATGHATLDASGAVTAIVVDDPGSGYYTAPNVRVYNGTLFDPIACQLAAAAAARVETMKSNDQGRIAPESSAVTRSTDSALSRSGPCGGSEPGRLRRSLRRPRSTILSVTRGHVRRGLYSAPDRDHRRSDGTPAPAQAPPPR